jgi:hypothetical protein
MEYNVVLLGEKAPTKIVLTKIVSPNLIKDFLGSVGASNYGEGTQGYFLTAHDSQIDPNFTILRIKNAHKILFCVSSSEVDKIEDLINCAKINAKDFVKFQFVVVSGPEGSQSDFAIEEQINKWCKKFRLESYPTLFVDSNPERDSDDQASLRKSIANEISQIENHYASIRRVNDFEEKIYELRASLAPLPKEKRANISAAARQLMKDIMQPGSKPEEEICAFQKICEDNLEKKYPTYKKAILSFIAFVAVAALVGSVAVSAGFALGAWTSLAALLSHIAAPPIAIASAGAGFFAAYHVHSKLSPIDKQRQGVAEFTGFVEENYTNRV